MRLRFQPWQLAVLVVALCAGAIAFARWRKLSQPYDAPQLLAALPGGDRNTMLFLDVAKLRDGGVLNLLAGSKATEEPDYRNFVDQTGFDYRNDLDALAAVFNQGRIYAAVRGRFEWPQLAAYARSQGGTCQYTICTMPASSPERNISFYPIRKDVLALAITPEERGVSSVSPSQNSPRNVPQDPIWFWIPRSALQNTASFPAGLQLLLAPLSEAQSIAISAGPGKNGLRLRADVSLPSANSAATLTQQFDSLTKALRGASGGGLSSGGSGDLAGLLANGSVQQNGTSVNVEWPLSADFLKSLAADH